MTKTITTILAVVVLAAAAWYFLNGGMSPKTAFNPQAASNEIINRLGASALRRDLVTSMVCDTPLVGTSQVCMGHNLTPHGARQHIDAVMNATNARPIGAWGSSAVGYTRGWQYGDNDYGSYMIMVTNNMLNISWQEYEFLRR